MQHLDPQQPAVSHQTDRVTIERRRRTPSGDVRRLILDAADQLLESRGLTGVTIRAVASQAGTATMTVYNHFGDKQGLLAALAEQHFRELTRLLQALDASEPRQHLRRACALTHDVLVSRPRAYELMLGTAPGPAAHSTFAQLVRIIERGQAVGAFVDDDATALANAVWSTLHGALSIEVQQHDTEDCTTEWVNRIDMEVVLDLIERGVVRPGPEP